MSNNETTSGQPHITLGVWFSWATWIANCHKISISYTVEITALYSLVATRCTHAQSTLRAYKKTELEA